MAILFMSTEEGNTETYLPLLRGHLPEQDIRVWPDAMGDVSDIEYAIIGVPHSGILGNLPNLKAVLSLWAGVDALLADPDFPHHIPLARMVDPLLAVDMTHFAIHWALHFHRGLHHYAGLQARREWLQIAYPEASERRVGVMGLGVLGTDAATRLAALGFDVAGWDAMEKSIDGVTSFVGADQLKAFLNRTEILIVLLPLTDETRGIINTETLSMLPESAFVISLARGAHIVDADMIAALDAGRVERAVLDAFVSEPLPDNHPFWSHPGAILTPHVASKTTPRTAAAEIAIDFRRLQAGEAPRHLVDMEKGF
ncbi:MAG: glyoxylate/hydroxypyruvate reductase A [Rhodospirillales bacterium]|nr:glyoxylate/hydroxypyruvate reductase A [Alphaproteobacteria bacterium]MBL6929404.1 glyoxylate/hydroxypyruvate reductase A [Rhodospirillales bacterium]